VVSSPLPPPPSTTTASVRGERWVEVLPRMMTSPSRATHIMADDNWGESLRMTASQLLWAGTHYRSPPSTSTSSECGS